MNTTSTFCVHHLRVPSKNLDNSLLIHGKQVEVDMGQCTKEYQQTNKWLLSRNGKIQIGGFINETAILSTINHHKWDVASRHKSFSWSMNSHHLHVDDPQLLSWKDRLICQHNCIHLRNTMIMNNCPHSPTTTSSFHLFRSHMFYQFDIKLTLYQMVKRKTTSIRCVPRFISFPRIRREEIDQRLLYTIFGFSFLSNSQAQPPR